MTKRAIDLVLASVALVLLSPVLAVLWVLVRLRMGSPVLFRQQRPGMHGRPFEMVKFRTMTDMSLVGPRPLLMQYLPLYSPEQARRHEVRPGITGWAQVNGRNAVSWPEKFELDVWYVDHHTTKLDFEIMWKTVAQVFGGHGVSADGHATMAPFTGNDGASEP